MNHNWKLSLADRENFEKCFLKRWQKWYTLESIRTIAGKDYIVMDDKEFYEVIFESDIIKSKSEFCGLSFRKAKDSINGIVVIKDWG